MLHVARLIFITLMLALVPCEMIAQSSSSIRRDQKRNRQQVEKTKKNIKANSQAVENNLRELELLDGQIDDIAKDLRVLYRRSDSINRLIVPLRDSIKQMDSRLDGMCEKYRVALHKSQANANGLNDITFVFSSSNFKQAWQRYRTLRQFSRWRDRKALEIVEVRSQLQSRKLRLDSLRNANARVLSRVQQNRNEIERKRVETDRIIKSLKSQNKQLQQVLKRRETEALNLERRLEKALAEELEQRRRQEEKEARERRQREEEQRRQAATKDTIKSAPSVKEEKKAPKPPTRVETDNSLTGSFEGNKGKLPFPVDGQYTIVKKFGRQKHPRLAKVETNNPGIDIETSRGAAVRSVYDGEISQIFKLAGYNNIVVVRHGDYVTVYANLVDLKVKKGDRVTTGQTIGSVFVDKADGNRSVLHFELRHEKDKQDPEAWLRR